MRRNTQGLPIVLTFVAAALLAINLLGLWYCHCQIADFASRVSSAEAALDRQVASDETEYEIPERNEPQGSLSGNSGWLAFYQSLMRPAQTSLPITIILFGISLLFIRERRSG